jgi:hypothetical protein
MILFILRRPQSLFWKFCEMKFWSSWWAGKTYPSETQAQRPGFLTAYWTINRETRMDITSHCSNIGVLPVLFTLTVIVLLEYYSYVEVLTKQRQIARVFSHNRPIVSSQTFHCTPEETGNWHRCCHYLYKVIESFIYPTDAQLSCSKNVKIYIKIYMKGAPTCFGL